MEANDTAAMALDAQGRKQARTARWSRILGIIVLIAALCRLAFFVFGGETVRGCDETEVQSAVSDIINDAIKKGGSATGPVKDYSDVREVRGDGKSRLCSARVTLSDGSSAKVTYRVVPRKVVVESLD